MKLIAFPLSPFSAKIRIALAEKQLACEVEDVPTDRAGVTHKSAQLLAINPRGQVPALVDGELAIYDSTVIAEYLEDRQPEPALLPRDAVSRARCRQLEDAGDELTSGAFVVLVREIWRKSDPAVRDAEAIGQATRELVALATRLDRTLEGRDWLVGRFSIADIACYVPFALSALLGVGAPPQLERFHAWLSRMSKRASVAADAELMQKDAARIAALSR